MSSVALDAERPNHISHCVKNSLIDKIDFDLMARGGFSFQVLKERH